MAVGYCYEEMSWNCELFYISVPASILQLHKLRSRFNNNEASYFQQDCNGGLRDCSLPIGTIMHGS